MPYRQSRFAILAPWAVILYVCLAATSDPARAQTGGGTNGPAGGDTPVSKRQEAITAIPMSRLTPAAQQRITAVTSRTTLYRHLSQQTIECDADLFLFIVRNPEVLVGIWDLMEITQIQTQRLDTYQLRAVDGSGTDCTVDLVYGDAAVHVYVADGFYEGKLVANPINGKGVFVLRSTYRTDALGNTVVEGTLDCFIQIEQIAADLILRTFGPLIGRTADGNFAETARFIDQLGTNARRNPSGLEELARRLPQVSEPTRQRFAAAVRQAAERYHSTPQVSRIDSTSRTGR